MRPTLTLASPELLDRIIHEAKLILAEIGIEVRGPTLFQRLRQAGLPTDASGARLLLPPHAIDHAIAVTPTQFRVYDRYGDAYVELGGGVTRFAPGSSGLRLLDHRSGETRAATTTDFVEYARLTDGLDHIALASTAFSTHDLAPQISDAWRLYLALTNTRKPLVTGAFTEQGVPRMAEMLALFRRDRSDLAARPSAIFTITAAGNFRYSEDSCQNLIDCLDWGLPVEIVPVTIIGLIAPVTVVGAAVFHTADVLAGITMAQMLKPGHPVLFGGAAATFHMRQSTSPMPTPEALRLVALYAAIGQRLGLPTSAYTALSESKSLDAQAGAETFASALVAAQAGVSLVSGPGMLDYILTFHLPKLVVDNEICGQALHFMRDVDAHADLPALELARAQINRGHLLTAPHTLAHWPDELHLPGPAWDRSDRESWQRTGSHTLAERAIAEVESRLANYIPVVTDPAIDHELRQIMLGGLPPGSTLPEIAPAGAPLSPASAPRIHRRPRP